MNEERRPLRVTFGGFVFDSAAGMLRRGGRAVKMSDKMFAALEYLIRHRRRDVGKDELLDYLWPDEDEKAGENTLSALVHALRDALGDNKHHPRFILTRTKIGYRFCAEDVAELVDAAADPWGCWLLSDDRRLPLTDGENVVGRDPRHQVVLTDRTVSRTHAAVIVRGAVVVVEDRGSKLGTFLERAGQSESKVSAAEALTHGDIIRFGSVAVEFQTSPGLAAEETVGAESLRLRRKTRYRGNL